MKCSPDTRDCPLRRQSRHGRRPARRGATVKTGIGSRDKDTGLCNSLYTSRQRRPMPNLRQAVPRMFAAACSGCRRVFLCRCGQSAMMRCDGSLPTYGKRIGAYMQIHDTYGRSIYPYRKIYGQSIAVYARTYGRTIPMQASQYRHAGMKAWRHGGMQVGRHTAETERRSHKGTNPQGFTYTVKRFNISMLMEKEPVYLAFSTQKGGAGKTTLTVLVASYLHYVKGYDVAVVDCDYPQHSIAGMRPWKTTITRRWPTNSSRASARKPIRSWRAARSGP